jgi:hypothetical protein
MDAAKYRERSYRFTEGRFADTNALFENPSNVNITIPAGLTVDEEIELILADLDLD